MNFGDKDQAIEGIKRSMRDNTENLHPEDRADVFGKISEYACDMENNQRDANEMHGVPERDK